MVSKIRFWQKCLVFKKKKKKKCNQYLILQNHISLRFLSTMSCNLYVKSVEVSSTKSEEGECAAAYRLTCRDLRTLRRCSEERRSLGMYRRMALRDWISLVRIGTTCSKHENVKNNAAEPIWNTMKSSTINHSFKRPFSNKWGGGGGGEVQGVVKDS